MHPHNIGNNIKRWVNILNVRIKFNVHYQYNMEVLYIIIMFIDVPRFIRFLDESYVVQMK
jgi:hypothetical protein